MTKNDYEKNSISLMGAVAMQIVGLFSNGKPLPMVAGMATGALCGVALAWLTLSGTHSKNRVH